MRTERLRSALGGRLRSREKLDAELRRGVLDFTIIREVEAASSGVLAETELFGHPVVSYELTDRPSMSMKVYLPSPEAVTAGYVPALWVEFLARGQADGMMMEVRENNERLIREADVDDAIGTRPEGLPVADTRVMLTRTLSILRDGVLVEPDDQGRIAS